MRERLTEPKNKNKKFFYPFIKKGFQHIPIGIF